VNKVKREGKVGDEFAAGYKEKERYYSVEETRISAACSKMERKVKRGGIPNK
jgi:hypothetical protein